ncbi:phytanoyl-CoA dioxygenase family protein [Streptomyces sp. TRM66268-LWL]|uniref:Phytanoyl-CoA dioxygenase family protein n=1 Tax=Streptomyces polyasparticus TaxID=2767826 RepID=A0ABR7SUH6_9ACTN|nr:phytanoyl-CoA dioxygenase family protein [Streptomyces polyasparticus]MBC9718449.1 phytanoyl-CoA dioxygenase family protein [Streptomyces polyasparticus]
MTSPADPDVLAAFERDSFVVLRDAITPDVRVAARDAAERLLATDTTTGRDRSADGKDGFRGVIALDDAFLPLLANEQVLRAVIALLASTNLHLLSSNLIAMPSLPQGARRTIRVPERHGWHRDMAAANRDLGTDRVPRLAIKCAYFLTDPAPDAGFTMVKPASHHESGPVTVPAGAIDPPGAITPDIGTCDVMLFENRTWHAGGLNSSGHTRLAVMMQYGYRWLAQLDDPAPGLRARSDLTAVEEQLIGGRDRHADGSIAPETTGAEPLRRWWQHLSTTPPRSP